MANSAFDFAPERFFLLKLGEDGPSRIQGNTTYSKHAEATHAAREYLEDGLRTDEIIVAKVAGLHRLEVHTNLVNIEKP